MKISIIVIIVVALGFVFYLGLNVYRSESAPIEFYEIKFSELDKAVMQLSETGGNNGSYALFAFFPKDPSELSHVELQFSIEEGKIGFDWVLIGDIKSRDKDKFLQIAHDGGYIVSEKTENNVNYLRVEDGDLLALCRKLMRDLYGVSESTKIELVAARFNAVGFPLSTMP